MGMSMDIWVYGYGNETNDDIKQNTETSLLRPPIPRLPALPQRLLHPRWLLDLGRQVPVRARRGLTVGGAGAGIGRGRGRVVAGRADAGDAVGAQEDGHGEGGYGGVDGL